MADTIEDAASAVARSSRDRFYLLGSDPFPFSPQRIIPMARSDRELLRAPAVDVPISSDDIQ
jgi:hypothetical protein